jgi:MerR family transcriptional regulator, copper efflux regulator
MRIGELAALTGVSADTIRYYERLGLMPPPHRTANGYREYPAMARNRIRVIRNAVQLGFPLDEIAKVLRIRDAGGAPCRQVRDYAQTLVCEIDQRIAQLESEKTAMLRMIESWNGILDETRGDTPARLLERDEIAPRRPVARASRLSRSRRSPGGRA